MPRFLKNFGDALIGWLERPSRVLLFCLVFGALQLLIQGNLLHLFRMHADREMLAGQLVGIQKELFHLETRIDQAKDPTFIEREAKDRLDMAGEDELVFVFAAD